MKQLVHETDKLTISTVKLGMEVNAMDSFLGINPDNLLYETMVFPLVNGEPNFSSPIETKRYATQTEAEAGHQAMVQKYT